MDTIDILAVLLPTDIFQLIIFSGIVYFVLIFYGTRKWRQYSEFDKVVFSVILGGFIWYFFILPISLFEFIFNVFQKPDIKIPSDFLKYSSYFTYFILAFYLIYWRLGKNNNKPLEENNNFLKDTKSVIVGIILFIAVMNYAFLVAFSFTTYQENSAYILGSFFISIVMLLFFYFTFDKIFLKKGLPACKEEKLFLDFEMLKNNKKLVVLIILVIPAISALVGILFLKTTTQLVDEKNTRLEIPRIETWNYRKNLTGDFDVEQYYTITFKSILWVKIKSNISLLDIYGKPYRTHLNYTFSGNHEVIINNSRWNTINVSLVGKKHEDNLPKIYTIEKKDLNDSIQVWNIIFTNPYEFPIELRQVAIERDRQYEFINYTINNLLTDENNKIQLDQEIITFNYIVVWGKGVHTNQSQYITLFFKKKS